MVEGLRPDLHRYVSRLVGSAIDGEDVVQDTLAKAFYALSQCPEVPALRPWLFTIARNTALDLLRRYERTHQDALPEGDQVGDASERPEPLALRAAVSTFLRLPVSQRSAVIMKDVLGESLQDIAAHLGTSVEAVKALLVRGRGTLAAQAARPAHEEAHPPAPALRALMHQYVSLFNQRDWAGVQALLLEECRLDLVSKSQRRGKAVGAYFGRYAREPESFLRVGTCEGRPCLGLFRGRDSEPATLIFLEHEDGRVSFIRDFRYVPYLTGELCFVPDPGVP